MSQTTQSQTTSQIGDLFLRVNNEFVAWILPWAKANHPEKYEQTLRTSTHPATFRKYLVRLTEIRWETEPTTRSETPLHLLEETSIVARLRDRKNDEIIEVKGRNATGGRVWAFKELQTLSRDSFDALRALKQSLDLELVEE
jgi:hypothetical protein